MNEAKVTILKSQFSRKRASMLNKTASSGRPAQGDMKNGSTSGKGDIGIGKGGMGTLHPVKSLGRQFLGDKAANAIRYAKQAKADRRAFIQGGAAA